MWTRSEFHAGPGKGKYFPEQVGIKCWNGWNEHGDKIKCCMTDNWQSAPRIWKQGHVETFRLEEDFMEEDIHPKQADETVKRLVLDVNKKVRVEHATVLSPADIERRVLARIAKDEAKEAAGCAKSQSRSRSPRRDGEGKASDDDSSVAGAGAGIARRAPTIVNVARAAEPASNKLKRIKSSQSLAGATSPAAKRQTPTKAGSAVGEEAKGIEDIGASLATVDQLSLKWQGQCDKVSHEQALEGKLLGRERHTLRLYAEEAEELKRKGEASRMDEHRMLNEDLEQLSVNQYAMMGKIPRSKLNEVMQVSKDRGVEWGTNPANARVKRELQDWTSNPKSIKNKFKEFVEIAVPWLLKGEDETAPFDPTKPKYRSVEGTPLEKSKWFLKAVLDEVITPLLSAGIEHKAELLALLEQVCTLCDQASDNENVSEDYDDGLELLTSKCRGVARIIERTNGIIGSNAKDVEVVESESKLNGCTLLATIRAVSEYKAMYSEYTITKKSQKELIPQQDKAIKMIKGFKSGEISAKNLQAITTSLTLYKDCVRGLRPTQAVDFEAALTTAITSCDKALDDALQAGTFDDMIPYAVVEKFIKTANETIGTNSIRDAASRMIAAKSAKEDRAEHVTKLAEFSTTIIEKYPDKIAINAAELAEASSLVGTIEGQRLKPDDVGFKPIKALLDKIESACAQNNSELGPSAPDSLALIRSCMLFAQALHAVLAGETPLDSTAHLYVMSDGVLETFNTLVQSGTTPEERLKAEKSFTLASGSSSACRECNTIIREHTGDASHTMLLKTWLDHTESVLDAMAACDLPAKKSKAQTCTDNAVQHVESVHTGKWLEGSVPDEADEFIAASATFLSTIDISALSSKLQAAEYHIKKYEEASQTYGMDNASFVAGLKASLMATKIVELDVFVCTAYRDQAATPLKLRRSLRALKTKYSTVYPFLCEVVGDFFQRGADRERAPKGTSDKAADQ